MESAQYLYRSGDWRVNELCAIMEAHEELNRLSDEDARKRLKVLLQPVNWRIKRPSKDETKCGHWVSEMDVVHKHHMLGSRLMVRSTDGAPMIKAMSALTFANRHILGSLSSLARYRHWMWNETLSDIDGAISFNHQTIADSSILVFEPSYSKEISRVHPDVVIWAAVVRYAFLTWPTCSDEPESVAQVLTSRYTGFQWSYDMLKAAIQHLAHAGFHPPSTTTTTTTTTSAADKKVTTSAQQATQQL